MYSATSFLEISEVEVGELGNKEQSELLKQLEPKPESGKKMEESASTLILPRSQRVPRKTQEMSWT